MGNSPSPNWSETSAVEEQRQNSLEPTPEEIRYAGVLEKGMRLGLLALLVTFPLYVFGMVKPRSSDRQDLQVRQTERPRVPWRGGCRDRLALGVAVGLRRLPQLPGDHPSGGHHRHLLSRGHPACFSSGTTCSTQSWRCSRSSFLSSPPAAFLRWATDGLWFPAAWGLSRFSCQRKWDCPLAYVWSPGNVAARRRSIRGQQRVQSDLDAFDPRNLCGRIVDLLFFAGTRPRG